MTRKQQILLPLADGAWTGSCCLLAGNVLLTEIFPVDTLPLYLLAVVTALAAAVPVWLVFPGYAGIGPRLRHLLAAVPGFVLMFLCEFVNLMTIRWYAFPIRASNDADGLLLLLFFWVVFLFVFLVRLVLVFVRRREP